VGRIVIPHELTHLVFGTATKKSVPDPPHWLNEGSRLYLPRATARARAETSTNRPSGGEIMPLRALVGQFPTTADRFGLATTRACRRSTT